MLNARMQSLFSLAGQNALVTGSTAGVGLALARALGAAGANVIVNGRDEARVRAAVEQLTREGVEAFGAAFDVTDPAEVGEAVAWIEAEVGPLDALVNNAGVQRRAPLEAFEPETWRELMAINLDAVFYVGQAVAKAMIPRKRGRIVNIGSAQGGRARADVAPYGASKGGVKMLTRGMATDWGKHGIRVNAIAPGYFRTETTRALVDDEAFNTWLAERTPMRRWGELEELEGAVVFLVSEASSFVNGHVLYVDGGVTACL